MIRSGNMASPWNEIAQASEENRCELVLSGAEISQRIGKSGVDPSLFNLVNLNFLEISHTCLDGIPDEIAGLVNITRLVLRNNQLRSVSKCISSLRKLKFLDVSCNKIAQLPDELNTLSELLSLNVSVNLLSELPDLSALTHLVAINFAQNQLRTFPSTLCSLPNLSEINGSNNRLTNISAAIGDLSVLKLLDLSCNAIATIPGELGNCTKLKELNLKENPIKDKRLLKLIEQCHSRQVLDYIRNHCGKELDTGSRRTKQDSKEKRKKAQKKNEIAVCEVENLQDRLKVLHSRDNTPVVIITNAAQSVRPCILCCIVRNVSLQGSTVFRNFITLQTKLHETVCEKRTLATIATHDLKKIHSPLTFDAKAPTDIKIHPLGRKKAECASDLYIHLIEEAEALRKEKKRNIYSGIHKYLYLLKDKELYPCIIDSNSQVISLPPITNSEVTKISEETTDIFLEVTGNAFCDCRKVMESLILGILKLGIGKDEAAISLELNPTEDPNISCDKSPIRGHQLLLEQVRVLDASGHLKAVYPSRNDLNLDDVIVIRD